MHKIGCEKALTEDNSSVQPEGFRPMQFLKEVKAELKKVNWPGNKELVTDTGAVAVATIVVCALIWVCDTIFARIFAMILH